MITIIPNMTGPMGALQKAADPAVYGIHVPLDRQALAAGHVEADLEIDRSEILMIFNLNVVNLAEAFADRKRQLGSRIVTTGEGSAAAQLSLVPDQTRIAFRTPTGNPKWQKVGFTKPAPAKDGDVVVRLAAPMINDGNFFSVTGTSRLGGIFAPGADFQFNFTASLTDQKAYGAAVDGMIAAATGAMVGLVKP